MAIQPPIIRALYKSNVVRATIIGLVIVIAVLYRRPLIRQYYSLLSRLPSRLLTHHQGFSHFLHVLRNITPDISFVLLSFGRIVISNA